jgi:hypothetical protein
MTTTTTEAKTHRMCDAAYELIKGVHDDLGHNEAMHLFYAQLTAFCRLSAECCGDRNMGKAIVAIATSKLLQSLD